MAAHRWLTEKAEELGIAVPQAPHEGPDGYSFLFTDPDANCWEIVGARN